MSKNKKVDRNAKYKPWKALIPFTVPFEASSIGVVAAFQNHLLTIFIKETDSPNFAKQNGDPSKVAHLMIQWSDKNNKSPIPYKYLQRAKAELCGEQAEAVQLYPAAWREESLKQTHLFVLEQGVAFPIGLIPSDIEKKVSEVVGKHNVITKEEMEVFVVRHVGEPEIVEVFSSEEECKKMYADKDIPETSTADIEMIGDVPVETQNVVWTDSAKVKVANVIAKNSAGQIYQDTDDQILYDNDNPGYDPDVDDPIGSSISDIDDQGAPRSIEEDVALADAMKRGIKKRANDRANAVRAVTNEVTGRAQENIDAAIASTKKPKIIVP